MGLETLPIEPVVLELLTRARLVKSLRIVVIQSRPAGAISASRRACVIFPRLPTSTTCLSAKRRLILSIWVASVRGSAVSPSNIPTATGQPSAAHSRP
jgi:hypothetical protein